MRITVVAIVFVVTLGGLFLFENYKAPPQEQSYAKILSNLQQSNTPLYSAQPTKIPTKTNQPTKRPMATKTVTPSLTPAFTPSSTVHIYYTSSSPRAKYYYCDTDSGWKNLFKANLKQFSSPEELLKAYPKRTLHEPCK